MKNFKTLFILSCTLAVMAACSDTGNDADNPGKLPDTEDPGIDPSEEDPDYPNLTKVTYEESSEIFVNPERGWYIWHDSDYDSKRGKNGKELTKEIVRQRRAEGHSLIHLIYHLQDFVDKKDLSQDVLDNLDANMKALREGGAKCTMRFCYSDSYPEDLPQDAPLEYILNHISQLAPVLQANGDVIYAVEAGFIGRWGEWNHLDSAIGYSFHAWSTNAEYAGCRKVLDALLAAVPKDRMICVRTPFHKRKSYDLTWADSVTIATAYNQSDMSRLGGHNDAFLADIGDWGTYYIYGEESLKWMEGGPYTEEPDPLYWEKESRYMVMGGESENSNSPFHGKENTIKNLERFHWSYMNISFNGAVIQEWKNNGAFNEIARRLGYRFVLNEGYFTPQPSVGKKYEIALRLKNAGFAAPVNPRDVEFVFAEKGVPENKYRVKINVDPRYWFADVAEHLFYAELDLPDDMAAGKTYELFLNLPDPKPLLKDRPEYSIRLANTGVWREDSGFNKLHEFTL